MDKILLKKSDKMDKTETVRKIAQLKKEKNAIILAHYYTDGEIQALADYVGDSYYLAKTAKTTDADIVVFCGVGFMAESVKILNPDKKVLMPDPSADCPMAHMAQTEQIKELRRKYPDLAVVCYINATAALKCESDICVTSSNAVKIVSSLPNKNIFFIPDENLGRYVAKQVPEKNIILNNGFCPIHSSVTADEVLTAKASHPDALVLAHPECREDVLALSDYIGSTAEILDYAAACRQDEFIICTEEGVGFPLRCNNPEKQFHFVKQDFCCPDMKLNTAQKLLQTLITEENEISIDEVVRKRALLPLDRMLDAAK